MALPRSKHNLTNTNTSNSTTNYQPPTINQSTSQPNNNQIITNQPASRLTKQQSTTEPGYDNNKT